MTRFGSIAATLAAGAGLLQAVAAVTPITIKGNAFFNGTDRFYIRGIDYQPGMFTTRNTSISVM